MGGYYCPLPILEDNFAEFYESCSYRGEVIQGTLALENFSHCQKVARLGHWEYTLKSFFLPTLQSYSDAFYWLDPPKSH